MKAISAAMLASACVFPGVALAQSASTGQSSGTGLTMPYQSTFWGHAGLSLGRSELGARCPAGQRCDNTDTVWRLYGGGRFNNIFGGEVGYVNFGDFARGGGETEAQGLDFTLVAGVPFGSNQNWAVFGKLGTIYSWTDVSGVGTLRTGDAEGFSPRYGVGLQMGITPNWAVRADIDRYRVRLPEGRQDMDTFTLGAQYTFR